MPAPSVPTYAAAALIAAHTAFRDLVDSGAAGLVKIRTSADALLCTITLTDPCGTVNGTSGQLTLTAANTPNASATGTAAYAEICKSDGTVYLSLAAQAGSASVSGKIVLNTLSLVSGGPVQLVSCTIG